MSEAFDRKSSLEFVVFVFAFFSSRRHTHTMHALIQSVTARVRARATDTLQFTQCSSRSAENYVPNGSGNSTKRAAIWIHFAFDKTISTSAHRHTKSYASKLFSTKLKLAHREGERPGNCLSVWASAAHTQRAKLPKTSKLCRKTDNYNSIRTSHSAY